MSVWNKILAVIAMSALFAAPAFADGTPGKRVNRGPAPVQPHQPVPPEPGCYLIEDGKAWSCPALKTHKPAPAPAPMVHQPRATNKPCCGTFTRTIVKEHPPVVTKRTVTHRSAPQQTVQRRTVTTRKTVHGPTEIRLDMASFSGGVGNGVDGGFYGGGGGAVILTSGRSFSGVLSHGASAFTFSHRSGGKRGGKKRYGGRGGCGCK